MEFNVIRRVVSIPVEKTSYDFDDTYGKTPSILRMLCCHLLGLEESHKQLYIDIFIIECSFLTLVSDRNFHVFKEIFHFPFV